MIPSLEPPGERTYENWKTEDQWSYSSPETFLSTDTISHFPHLFKIFFGMVVILVM